MSSAGSWPMGMRGGADMPGGPGRRHDTAPMPPEPEPPHARQQHNGHISPQSEMFAELLGP